MNLVDYEISSDEEFEISLKNDEKYEDRNKNEKSCVNNKETKLNNNNTEVKNHEEEKRNDFEIEIKENNNNENTIEKVNIYNYNKKRKAEENLTKTNNSSLKSTNEDFIRNKKQGTIEKNHFNTTFINKLKNNEPLNEENELKKYEKGLLEDAKEENEKRNVNNLKLEKKGIYLGKLKEDKDFKNNYKEETYTNNSKKYEKKTTKDYIELNKSTIKEDNGKEEKNDKSNINISNLFKEKSNNEKEKNLKEQIFNNKNFFESNNLMNINVDENNFDEIFLLPENEYSDTLNKKIEDLSKLYEMDLTINKNITNSNECKNPYILEKIMQIFNIDAYSSNYPLHIYNPHDFLSVDLFNEKNDQNVQNKVKTKWSNMN